MWDTLEFITVTKALSKLDLPYNNAADCVTLHPSEVTTTALFLPHSSPQVSSDQVTKQLKENKESSLILPVRIFPLLLMASWHETWKGLSDKQNEDLKIVTGLVKAAADEKLSNLNVEGDYPTFWKVSLCLICGRNGDLMKWDCKDRMKDQEDLFGNKTKNPHLK